MRDKANKRHAHTLGSRARSRVKNGTCQERRRQKRRGVITTDSKGGGGVREVIERLEIHEVSSKRRKVGGDETHSKCRGTTGMKRLMGG